MKQLELVQAEIDQLYAEEEEMGQLDPKTLQEAIESEQEMMEEFISLIVGKEPQIVAAPP